MKYNVYIVNYETDKASVLIGSNLTEGQADKRVMSGLTRVNREYGVFDVEVGSEQDLKYAQDVHNE